VPENIKNDPKKEFSDKSRCSAEKIPVIHMFIGKGGVGKSTSSALTALHGARQKYKTLLVSMDPAHNQSDIFETQFSHKSTRILETLDIIEVNEKIWEKKYLQQTLKHLQETYNYQSAFGMQGYFKVLRHSPGIEEFALTLAFSNILKTFKDKDLLIFDMPPTAQSLRFLSLPSITRIWLKELIQLRKAILKKKEIITKIKIGTKEFEQDRISSRLGEMNGMYQQLETLFGSNDMHINLVMNPDRLAFSESLRTVEKLGAVNLAPSHIFLNKIQAGDDIGYIQQTFDTKPILCLNMSRYPLTGIDALSSYLNEQHVVFSDFLTKDGSLSGTYF
jgi:arsenite-transporting ATPase